MSKTKATPEQEKAELDARIAGFNKEVGPLLGKYELGLTGQPVIINGCIYAQAIVVDARKKEDAKPVAA